MHQLTITTTPEGSRFSHLGVCSCQWQTFAESEEAVKEIHKVHVINQYKISRTGGIVQGRL